MTLEYNRQTPHEASLRCAPQESAGRPLHPLSPLLCLNQHAARCGRDAVLAIISFR
jgi:hypothetical protein